MRNGHGGLETLGLGAWGRDEAAAQVQHLVLSITTAIQSIL